MINYTYNDKSKQICTKLGYRCPRAITATITDCEGCVLPQLPSEPTRPSEEEIWESMIDEMPFHISEVFKPYILEALNIALKHHTPTEKASGMSAEEWIKEHYPPLIVYGVDGLTNEEFFNIMNQFASTGREKEERRQLLIKFLMDIDECYGMHVKEEAVKVVDNYLEEINK